MLKELLSKLDRNWRVVKEEWEIMKIFVRRDWQKGTLHSRTAGVHASIIECLPRLWFYKFWPQWTFVAYLVDYRYNGGAGWAQLLSYF